LNFGDIFLKNQTSIKAYFFQIHKSSILKLF
jgi:hypothetical protein